MGTISHNVIIVTCWSGEHAETVRNNVNLAALNVDQEPGRTEDWSALVSPLVPSVMNGYVSFMVAPDGSKEWWDTSDKGDELRDRIIETLDTLNEQGHYSEYVEVRFGELGNEIVRPTKGPALWPMERYAK